MLLLARVDHRADLRARLHAVADHELLRTVDHGLREGGCDRVVHVDPLGAHADLARIAEAVARGEGGGGIDVGIGKDDERVLSAELEDQSLQAARSGLHDVTARRAAAGERDQVDRCRHERLALDLVTDRHLQHIRRQHGHQALGPLERAERAELARLEDDGVPGDQRGHHRVTAHEHREVPRRDADRDAERRVEHRRHGALVLKRLGPKCRDDLGTGFLESARCVVRLALRLGDRLAHLARDEFADRAAAFLHRDRGARHEPRAFLQRDRGPAALGLPSPVDHQPDALDRCGFEFADQFARRRIGDAQHAGDRRSAIMRRRSTRALPCHAVGGTGSCARVACRAISEVRAMRIMVLLDSSLSAALGHRPLWTKRLQPSLAPVRASLDPIASLASPLLIRGPLVTATDLVLAPHGVPTRLAELQP